MSEVVQEVAKLPMGLRQWLYKFVWYLIRADHWITDAELEALREAMRWVRKEDMNRLEALAAKLGSDFPLEAPSGISDEQARLMWMEVVRVAVIDGKLAIVEMNLIERAGQALGFGSQALEQALILAQEMAKKKLEELLQQPPERNFFRRSEDRSFDPSGQEDLDRLVFNLGSSSRVAQ